MKTKKPKVSFGALFVTFLGEVRGPGFILAAVTLLPSVVLQLRQALRYLYAFLPGEVNTLSGSEVSQATLFAMLYVFLTPFVTFRAFAFLNSRGGSDRIHALSCGRLKSFFAVLCASWAVTVPTLFLCCSLGLFLACAHPQAAVVWADVFRVFAGYLAAALLLEAAAALSAAVCGTGLSACTTLLILLLAPIFTWSAAVKLAVIACPENVSFSRLYSRGSVFGRVVNLMIQGPGKRMAWEAYLLVLTAAVTAAAAILYAVRPSETSGAPFVSSLARNLVRSLLAFPFSVWAAAFAMSPVPLRLFPVLIVGLSGLGAVFLFEFLAAGGGHTFPRAALWLILPVGFGVLCAAAVPVLRYFCSGM